MFLIFWLLEILWIVRKMKRQIDYDENRIFSKRCKVPNFAINKDVTSGNQFWSSWQFICYSLTKIEVFILRQQGFVNKNTRKTQNIILLGDT